MFWRDLKLIIFLEITALRILFQVDLKCTRNVAVLGFSIMVGMIVPSYFRENPIDTGPISFQVL